MDLVGELYRRINRSDADGVATLYHPGSVLEYVFADGADLCQGRELIRQRWAEEFATRTGALPAGRRVEVTRVAGIETGWGWVRADWTAGSRRVQDGRETFEAGYSHFWIEDGTIRRHRRIATARSSETIQPAPAPDAGPRRYPTRPVVGVGAVVFDDAGRVVLVRRRHEPLAGQWSLPGGTLEVGESLEAGVAREVREETGLDVEVGPVVEVFDRILLDAQGAVQFHFVLVDYLCVCRLGTPTAGSDVSDAAAVSPDDLRAYRLTEKAGEVIRRAVVMRRQSGPTAR